MSISITLKYTPLLFTYVVFKLFLRLLEFIRTACYQFNHRHNITGKLSFCNNILRWKSIHVAGRCLEYTSVTGYGFFPSFPSKFCLCLQSPRCGAESCL